MTGLPYIESACHQIEPADFWQFTSASAGIQEYKCIETPIEEFATAC
jgi:hypothetical protein